MRDRRDCSRSPAQQSICAEVFIYRALRVRAAQHGHSTEAEVREILAAAVKPGTRVRLGDALAALGRKVGLTNQDLEVFQQVRDKTPAEPTRFE